MTWMRAGTSLNISLIGPPTAELAALERLKNPHRLIMGKGCLHFFSAVLDRILFILAGNAQHPSHKCNTSFFIQHD